tara:strand:+ start:1243 stop:1725 length:483 start_codon:yes stop_codon:yes gene_type:complete
MEEESVKKNFKIVGDDKKKVVKFGASKIALPKEESPKEEQLKTVEPVAEKPTTAEAERKKPVNDNFAKHSSREPLEEGEYPRELKYQFSINTEFEEAFEKLSEGQREGYLFYFLGPKLTASITNRIVKKIDRILLGHGLNDCTCGHSKNMPNCDGSHKNA